MKVGIACEGGSATCMLSACRGGWPRLGPLQGRSATAKAPLQRGDRLLPGPLQGATTRRGSSPQGVATRGHGRLRLALSPAREAAPAIGVAAPWQGDCRPQRAAVAYAGAAATAAQ
ncbi:hypothetical protein B296_00042085 [Ensete ventricosum]|uniref:Uncharacterized protein n=1 Tax=Ensete ventricosum TaxID=4639 RepID=A0A426X3B1_ENSVE|nr:hypothetical protein B296_00042085 [Ensete ventricosum]